MGCAGFAAAIGATMFPVRPLLHAGSEPSGGVAVPPDVGGRLPCRDRVHRTGRRLRRRRDRGDRPRDGDDYVLNGRSGTSRTASSPRSRLRSQRPQTAPRGHAFEHATAYANERRVFGKTLVSKQGVSFKLADMAIQVEAARLLVWRAAAALETGGEAGLLGSYAKAFAADIAMTVTTDAVQVLGGAGIMRDHPVEKWLRDAKVLQIVEGTSEIQRHVIVQYLRRV